MGFMKFYCVKRTYTHDLSNEMDTILSEVDSFLGFAPFIPKDIHEELTVYLDDKEEREIKVTKEELDRELKDLEKEKKEVNKRINKKDADEEDLVGRQDLENRIDKLKDLLDECVRNGKDHIVLKQNLLGYYTRRGKSGGKEIVLLMESIGNDSYLAAGVYIHELMHAFFDNHNIQKSHCPCAEEPLAEYGMLCFMEMFTRMNPIFKRDLFDVARSKIKNKKLSPGTCHYGYGLYLFEDKETFCVDWINCTIMRVLQAP